MKDTGIVRRIDDLGRIVIPKEIRDSLNMNNGDEIEIFLENGNIILHKYSKLWNDKDRHDKIISSLNSMVDGVILLADNDKIVSHGFYENKNISKEIKLIVLERKVYQSTELESYWIGNELLTGYFFFDPIIHDSIIKGTIILIKDKPVTQEDKLFSRVLKNIIDNF